MNMKRCRTQQRHSTYYSRNPLLCCAASASLWLSSSFLWEMNEFEWKSQLSSCAPLSLSLCARPHQSRSSFSRDSSSIVNICHNCHANWRSGGWPPSSLLCHLFSHFSLSFRLEFHLSLMALSSFSISLFFFFFWNRAAIGTRSNSFPSLAIWNFLFVFFFRLPILYPSSTCIIPCQSFSLRRHRKGIKRKRERRRIRRWVACCRIVRQERHWVRYTSRNGRIRGRAFRAGTERENAKDTHADRQIDKRKGGKAKSQRLLCSETAPSSFPFIRQFPPPLSTLFFFFFSFFWYPPPLHTAPLAMFLLSFLVFFSFSFSLFVNPRRTLLLASGRLGSTWYIHGNWGEEW